MKNTNILINYKINALEKYILALMKKKIMKSKKKKKKFSWTYFFREIKHLVKHYFHSLDKHRKKVHFGIIKNKMRNIPWFFQQRFPDEWKKNFLHYYIRLSAAVKCVFHIKYDLLRFAKMLACYKNCHLLISDNRLLNKIHIYHVLQHDHSHFFYMLLK